MHPDSQRIIHNLIERLLRAHPNVHTCKSLYRALRRALYSDPNLPLNILPDYKDFKQWLLSRGYRTRGDQHVLTAQNTTIRTAQEVYDDYQRWKSTWRLNFLLEYPPSHIDDDTNDDTQDT